MADRLNPALLAEVAAGLHSDPHDILGPHRRDGGTTVRVLKPSAISVSIETVEGMHTAEQEHEGIWAVHLPDEDLSDYRIHAAYASGSVVTDDPYRFLPSLGDLDLHLIRQGRHQRLWQVLGANVHRHESALGDIVGTAFAVWAPSARAVRVVGDFNEWAGVEHAMRSIGASGLWELYIPGVGPGAHYKYEILSRDGHWLLKADPMAKATEGSPGMASIVEESAYDWGDGEWMEARADRKNADEPMSIYEVHLGSWKHGLDYRELADELVAYVAEMGFTHIEMLPVSEYPFDPSWGYQVTGYYAPTSRYGSPDDFKYLVDRFHQAGIGVLLDWVPGHFPKDEWALARFDGTPLYEHPDPLRAEQPDWGTLIFHFGRPEVRNFLVANALYWLQEFHADGLRVDAVAAMLYLDYSRKPGQWRPNIHGGRENLDAIEFLQEINSLAPKLCPGTVLIAEESTAWPGVTAESSTGGLGFGFKWNMGWMNDTLKYLREEPIHRTHHHGLVTFSMMYAFSERFLLPLSHDEVVHEKGSLWGKMPGEHAEKAAGVRSLLAYQWTHPGKQLLFMGGEFAQVREWSEARSIDWDLLEDPLHAGVHRLVRDLNALYASSPALWALDYDPYGFEWIDPEDATNSVLPYVRRDRKGNVLVVACNFADVAHEDYRLGFPSGGTWEAVLDTDSAEYGGAGLGPSRAAVEEEASGRWEHSASFTLPPLSVVVFRPVR
ncbi:MAG: 1,4-alpha-glucan branching protein GlgB [Demequinaceae bacterium]|nr:1,4-alpha-glucan branching protein GlgB [Demequinaceae bacterium]